MAAEIKEIALAEEKKVLKFPKDTYAQFGKLTEIREEAATCIGQ